MEDLTVIAGGGDYPYYLINEARKKIKTVNAIAFDDITDIKIKNICNSCIYMKIEDIDFLIDNLKKLGSKNIVMAGKVPHIKILDSAFKNSKLYKLFKLIPDFRTSTILNHFIKILEKNGFKVFDAYIFLESYIAKKGVYNGKLNENSMKDIKLGFNVAKKLTDVDVGQCVCVKDGVVIAVEAQEGTDECIKRAYSIAGAEFIVVKIAGRRNPKYDLPVIGKKTLEVLIETGASAIAVESGKTLIFDIEEFLKCKKPVLVGI